MQRAESKLMIEGVCGRLMDKNRKIPLYTVHDSISTFSEFVPTVRAAIDAGFQEFHITANIREKNGNQKVAWSEDDHSATVIDELLSRYTDRAKMDPKVLNELSQIKPRVDRAGKLAFNSAGQVVYNFGENKGVPVLTAPSYANWMLKQNFPKDTKEKLTQILTENPGLSKCQAA